MSYRRHLDWMIVTLTALLIALGVLFIWSSTYGSKDFAELWERQVRYAVCAIPIGILVLRVPYPRWVKMAPLLYGLLLFVLVLVLFFGTAKKGARRWIGFGDAMQLQPAEFAKVVLILMLAHLLAAPSARRPSIGRALLLALPLVVLIAAEPDLGSALVLVPVLFSMLYAAGARPRTLALILLTAPLLGVVLWFTPLIKDYQRSRVQNFLVPWRSMIENIDAERRAGRLPEALALQHQLEDLRRGDGFQQYQAMISVGSGGLDGKGLLKGPQNRLEYLPESHTDFIFAVVGEEWGFWGGTLLIATMLLLTLRLCVTAWATRDLAGRLIVVGVASQLFFQTFVNIGMNLGVMPITGVTLPFVSLGGSSLWASCIAIAMVLNVGLYRHRIFPF